VEGTIRDLVEGPAWHRSPVRFLVLDLTHVAGLDMSSAEAFVRLQRLLNEKRVVLVFCGLEADSPVAMSLQSVEVLGAEGVELFSTFNDAMECEFFSNKLEHGFFFLIACPPLTLRDRERVSESMVQIAEG
jgi:SulP family sulfate permease